MRKAKRGIERAGIEVDACRRRAWLDAAVPAATGHMTVKPINS